MGLRPWGDADFAAAREENVKRYQAGLADMKSGQFRVASKADAITPAHIVLTDFLRQVKPEVIGGVQPDSRVIYAFKPERGELALPMDLGAAVTYALQARERAAQVLSNPGDETLLRTNTHLLGTAVGKPVGVKVILSRSFSAGVNVEVMITAPNVIDYSGMALDLGSPLIEEPPAELTGRPKLTELDEALVRTPLYRSLYQFDAYGGPGGAAQSLLPATIRDVLKNPATSEPMATLPASWILSTADSLKTDVVAYLPDWTLGILLDRLRSKMDLKTLWRNQLKIGVKMENRGGLLVAQPSLPWIADRGRIDRAALGSLLRTYSERSIPEIRDFAAYCERVPRFDEYNLDTTWMKFLDPNGRVFPPISHPHAIRFVSSLKLNRAKRETVFQTAQLSARQIEDLQQLISKETPVYGPRFFATSSSNSDRYSIEAPGPLPAIPGGTLTVTRSIREARLVVKSNGDFWPVSKEELRGAPPANSLPMRMDHLSFRLEGGPGVIIRPHAQVRDIYLVSN